MVNAKLETRPFEPRTAGEAEFMAYNAFTNRMKAETLPDDPPTTLADTIGLARSAMPSQRMHEWAVWRQDEIVATGRVSVSLLHNLHLAEFDVSVVPEMRRRGLAKSLLMHVVESARTEGRRLLHGGTMASVPTGDAFMTRLGAQKMLEHRGSQLELSEVNREFLQRWLERDLALRQKYELGIWPVPYPVEHLPEIAAMYELMNNEPHGDLETERPAISVDEIQEWEASRLVQRIDRWTLYARHLEGGGIAGYTETIWNPEQPELLLQAGTAVAPAHQNQGLGSWLKAAMLDKVLKERPEVKRVRTSNAGVNAPMLRINEQLGFKPYQTSFAWQVSVDRVMAYLSG